MLKPVLQWTCYWSKLKLAYQGLTLGDKIILPKTKTKPWIRTYLVLFVCWKCYFLNYNFDSVFPCLLRCFSIFYCILDFPLILMIWSDEFVEYFFVQSAVFKLWGRKVIFEVPMFNWHVEDVFNAEIFFLDRFNLIFMQGFLSSSLFSFLLEPVAPFGRNF